MKFLNKYKSLFLIITNVYLFIIRLTWILVHLYFRLILKRSPYTLIDLKEGITNNQIKIFSLFVIIQVILIITISLELYRMKYNKQPNKFIFKISEKLSRILNIIYWEPLEYLFNLTAPHIPGSGRFFLYLEATWTKNFYGKPYFYTLIFIFDIFPKLIMAISFFIDVIILHQIKYFLYTIPLIFIPIIFQIFLKLMISFGVRNMPIIKDYFSEIKGINPIYNDKNQFIRWGAYTWIVKEEYEDVIDPYEEIGIAIQLQSIESYSLQIKEDINKASPYVILITSAIYMITGTYRLTYIFL